MPQLVGDTPESLGSRGPRGAYRHAPGPHGRPLLLAALFGLARHDRQPAPCDPSGRLAYRRCLRRRPAQACSDASRRVGRAQGGAGSSVASRAQDSAGETTRLVRADRRTAAVNDHAHVATLEAPMLMTGAGPAGAARAARAAVHERDEQGRGQTAEGDHIQPGGAGAREPHRGPPSARCRGLCAEQLVCPSRPGIQGRTAGGFHGTPPSTWTAHRRRNARRELPVIPRWLGRRSP
jgi:hypothetical protein